MSFKKNLINCENGFIVQVMFVMFYILERISLFHLFRWTWCQFSNESRPFVKKPVFPEIWTLSNLVAAFLLVYLIPMIEARWLLVVFIVYSAMRILEMFVYQINVLLFHRLTNTFLEADSKNFAQSGKIDQKQYHIKSATRTVILLLFNMFEYVVQFAVIFAAIEELSTSFCSHISIKESFNLFMNIGSLSLSAESPSLLIKIAYAETLIGIFVNITCLARFISILPSINEVGYGEK